MPRIKGQGAGVNPRSLVVLDQHCGVTPGELLDELTKHVPVRDYWERPARKPRPTISEDRVEFFERRKGRCPVCFMKRAYNGECSCD